MEIDCAKVQGFSLSRVQRVTSLAKNLSYQAERPAAHYIFISCLNLFQIWARGETLLHAFNVEFLGFLSVVSFCSFLVLVI